MLTSRFVITLLYPIKVWLHLWADVHSFMGVWRNYPEETYQNGKGRENHVLYETVWNILAGLLIYSLTKPFQSSYVQGSVLSDQGMMTITISGFQQWSL